MKRAKMEKGYVICHSFEIILAILENLVDV
jgi:hypothetical protein